MSVQLLNRAIYCVSKMLAKIHTVQAATKTISITIAIIPVRWILSNLLRSL